MRMYFHEIESLKFAEWHKNTKFKAFILFEIPGNYNGME